MSNYTGSPCPVCSKPFSEQDDIVVCPQCGTPYHRACYAQQGSCIFTDKHESGHTWQPESQAAEKHCPRCGAKNSSESLFCSNCGQSLEYNSHAHGQAPADSEQAHQRPPATPFPFDPMGGVNPNDHIEGIPASELAKFVQTNTPYYMGRFFNLSSFGRNRFHFAAFLFGGGWFLDRKQYLPGILLTVFQLAASVAASLLQMYYTIPIMDELLPNITPATRYYWGFLQAWDALIAKSPGTLILVMLPTVLFLLQFAQRIFCGVCANRLYLRHCVKKIGQTKAQATNPTEYDTLLSQQGGVNTPLAFSLMICYVIINFIPSIF